MADFIAYELFGRVYFPWWAGWFANWFYFRICCRCVMALEKSSSKNERVFPCQIKMDLSGLVSFLQRFFLLAVF